MTDYRPRLLGRLPGFSDRALDQHLALYEGAARELQAARSQLRLVSAAVPPAALSLPAGDLQRVLDTPIGQLQLSLEGGRLGDALARLRAETRSKGITWWPNFYLGGDDFWTTDRATSVNLPWYLGSEATWRMVNDRRLKLTEDDVLRILRHEYAHALLYAYEGWEAPGWEEAFGPFGAPYQDAYEPDAAAAEDYVVHLSRPGPGQLAHYPQKHPDEDWAETFAVWLAGVRPGEYEEGTGAARKLEVVARLVVDRGRFYGDPKVTALGRREPYQQLTETVGDYLGARAAYSEHSAILRRLPDLHAAVRLHELHFENLAPPAGGYLGLNTALLAAEAFGSTDAWLADLRAAAGSTSGWSLAAWDPRERRVITALVEGESRGVPPGCQILLAVDCHEHAYELDYGATGKHLGLAAQFNCVDWLEVERRLMVAAGIPSDLALA